MKYTKVYYEPSSLNYPLGQQLKQRFSTLEWIPILSHNSIQELQKKENRDFITMKSYLIIGIRKTHRYTNNQKLSDFLVPFTSSGCSAMCLYCYLVCSYNKCSYLRLYVNTDEIMDRLIQKSHQTEQPCTFEIGSNSDLILENTLTHNLEKIIEKFAQEGKGFLTFPTKFHMIEPLLNLNHKGKTIIRMSLNPNYIIQKVEIGTSSLEDRIEALNQLRHHGYPIGIVLAPVIFVENWQHLYLDLFDQLKEKLTEDVQKQMFIEIIFMTYSYIHRAINEQAFPKALKLYNQQLMTGGNRKYYYRKEIRQEAEQFLRIELEKRFPSTTILYVV